MKANKLYILVFSALLSISFLGCREDPLELEFFGNLSGTVTDESFEPLADVAISTNPATVVTATNPDGKHPQRITSSVPLASHDNFKMNYCWSPDGAELLFMHHRQLYRINRDGSGLKLMAEAPMGETFSEIDWIRTGREDRKLALTTGNYPYESHLYLLPEEEELQPLLTGIKGTISSPSFSIDGNQILFSRDSSAYESPDGRQLDARVYLFTLLDGNLQDLSINKEAGTNDLEPRFSPTGAKIIFTNTSNDGVSTKSIWVMDTPGQNRVKLYDDAEMPDWR